MSSEPMSEKRLTEIRRDAEHWGREVDASVGFAAEEMMDEIDRLRAENQRLGYEIQTLKLEREELPSFRLPDHCTCRDNYCLGLCPYSMRVRDGGHRLTSPARTAASLSLS